MCHGLIKGEYQVLLAAIELSEALEVSTKSGDHQQGLNVLLSRQEKYVLLLLMERRGIQVTSLHKSNVFVCNSARASSAIQINLD